MFDKRKYKITATYPLNINGRIVYVATKKHNGEFISQSTSKEDLINLCELLGYTMLVINR